MGNIISKEQWNMFWKEIDKCKGKPDTYRIELAAQSAKINSTTGKRYFHLGRNHDPEKTRKDKIKKIIETRTKKYVEFIKSENTIDYIIDQCTEYYGLKVNKKTRAFYTEYLESLDLKILKGRKAKKNPRPYFNSFVDKLILFSYLTGKTPIKSGHKENIQDKKINSVLDLYLLRRSEVGWCASKRTKEERERNDARKTDLTLIKLKYRLENKRMRYGLQGLKEVLNELGKNKLVYNHLTRDKKAVKKFKKMLGPKLSEEFDKGYINVKMINKCYSPNPLTSTHGGARYKK